MADNTDTYINLTVGSALCGVASYVLFRFYQSHRDTARQIREMVIAHPDAQLENQLRLQENHYLDYAAVEGSVKELKQTLHSRHVNKEGVVMWSQIVEHRLKFTNGVWVESKRTIQDNLNVVPFAIVNGGKDDLKYRVEVTKPTTASQLLDELETTFDAFEPNKNIVNIYDFFDGAVTKGFQITEQMLPTGVRILGVGKIKLEQDQMKLGLPDDPWKSYILTRMTPVELCQYYEAESENYKVMAGVAAGIGVSLAIYGLYRLIMSWLEHYHQRLMFEELRRFLAEQRRVQSNDTAGNETEQVDGGPRTEDICVVCLINDSQVIALPCRHFNMCLSCAEALPIPKRCPLCRADIERFIPMYEELD